MNPNLFLGPYILHSVVAAAGYFRPTCQFNEALQAIHYNI